MCIALMEAMKNGKLVKGEYNMLELKDKLNLLWKFCFLAVFAYGVISMTCCKKSCATACNKGAVEQSQCCTSKSVAINKNCGTG